MNTFSENLTVALKALDGPRLDDTKVIKLINELETSLIPSGFENLFQIDDGKIHERFFFEVKRRYEDNLAKTGRQCGLTELQREEQLCKHLFYLIFLLKIGIDTDDNLPKFISVDPTELALCKNDNTPVGCYIETILRWYIQVDPPKKIDDDKGLKTHKALCSQWTESQEFLLWLVAYLCLHLAHALKTDDLFFSIHSKLHHYRQYKLTVYLLITLCRKENDFQEIGEFANTSLELYYEILKNCGQMFHSGKMEHQMNAVETAIKNAKARISKSIKAATEKGGTSGVVISLMGHFFKHHIDQLSHAGLAHIFLWNLPMFQRVKDAFRAVLKAEGRGLNILLIGESGTGKEAIAELFLKTSGKPFVKINCAGKSWDAIAKDDLFKNNGRLAERVGAIFLDELDKATLEAQGGLLELLDKPSGEYRIPGELTPVPWNGLVIAAATSNIIQKIKKREFLEDLFWRFDDRAYIAPVKAMANSTNASDLDNFRRLFEYAFALSRAKFRLPDTIKLTEEQLKELQEYEWRGNLREVLEFNDALCVELADEMAKSGSVVAANQQMRLFNNVIGRFRAILKELESHGD